MTQQTRTGGGIDEDVLYWLLDNGVKREQAIYIASLVNQVGAENITMSGLYVLASLPTDETGRAMLTTGYGEQGIGGRQDLSQAVEYMATPEGQAWAKETVDDYWTTDEFGQPTVNTQSDLYQISTQYPPEGEQPFDYYGRYVPLAEEETRQQASFEQEKGQILASDLSFNEKQGAIVDLQRQQTQVAQTPSEFFRMQAEINRSLPAEQQEARALETQREQEELAAYQAYRKAGGTTGRGKWVEYGMPSGPPLPRELQYAQGLPEFDAPRTQQYYKGRYSDIYGEFLGGVGEEGTEAWAKFQTAPEEERAGAWEKFLGKYPWLEKYKGLPRQQRGEYPSTFRPRTRFLR